MSTSTTKQTAAAAFSESEYTLACEWLDPHNTGMITHHQIKQFTDLLGLNYTHKHIKTMLKQQNSITLTQLHTLLKHNSTCDSIQTSINEAYSILTSNTPHIHNIANMLLNARKIDNITDNDIMVLQQICSCDKQGNISLHGYQQLIHQHKGT